jgi:regulatory protein
VATRRRCGPRGNPAGPALEETAEHATGQKTGDATASPGPGPTTTPAHAGDDAPGSRTRGMVPPRTGRTPGRAPGRATAGAISDTPERPPDQTARRATNRTDGQPEAKTRDPEATARELCLRLLTTAPRTRTQLATALRRRGLPDSVADGVLGRFAETGLIDDAAFACAWVESRHHSRGLSRRLLATELRQRGVGDDDVRHAIGGLDPQQEAVTARRLVDSKLAATRGQPPRARTRRLAGMLARKGYPAALVFRVVREALGEEGIDAGNAGLDESEEAAFEAADTWPDGAGGW